MALIKRLGYAKVEPKEPEQISFFGAVILTIAFVAVGYILTVLAFLLQGRP